MMDKNIANWDDIYSNSKAGSFLSYPNENLVTLFFQNKKSLNLNGKCLDYGFGSANNAEFLIQHMGELYGIEIAESSVNIAEKRLAKFGNFNLGNFLVSGSEPNLTRHFDLIVAWQMLYYNDKQGLHSSIAKLYEWLKPEGMLFCTLITPRDVKVKNAKQVESNTYVIDGRIPTQEGCRVFSPNNEQEFLALFNRFEVVDCGYYERASSLFENTASEYYLVAKKK
jgi:ubiquinone/menaquinone biosynthesis C-methylase UbiE